MRSSRRIGSGQIGESVVGAFEEHVGKLRVGAKRGS